MNRVAFAEVGPDLARAVIIRLVSVPPSISTRPGVSVRAFETSLPSGVMFISIWSAVMMRVCARALALGGGVKMIFELPRPDRLLHALLFGPVKSMSRRSALTLRASR